MTLGRRGREPVGRDTGTAEPWAVVEVEELPPQRVISRGSAPPRLRALVAAAGGLALLAVGLGAFGGRPSRGLDPGVTIGPASPEPMAAYTGAPLVQPAVPCGARGRDAPGVVLHLGSHEIPGLVVVDVGPGAAPPTTAPLAVPPATPPALDVRSDVVAEIRTVGDVCAIAWLVQLEDDAGGAIELATMGNPTGNPLLAAQNRLSLPLALHRGRTGSLQALLGFPDVNVRAFWRVRILPFQAPSARLTIADQPIDLAQGCDVDITFASGWSERVNPCFDDVDRAQEPASIEQASALLFRFRDGWRVEGPVVGCGQLSDRRFRFDPDCRVDARVDGDALVIDPPVAPGTWTLSIGACGIQELADATNTICGTWYATLDVAA